MGPPVNYILNPWTNTPPRIKAVTRSIYNLSIWYFIYTGKQILEKKRQIKFGL